MNPPSTYQVEYGAGVTGVAPTGTAGEYDVTFDRDVAGCIPHAAAAAGKPRTMPFVAQLNSYAGVLMDPAPDAPGVKDDVARAQFYNQNGNPVDTSFVITLLC